MSRFDREDNSLSYQRNQLKMLDAPSTQIGNLLMGMIIGVLITSNLMMAFCIGGLSWCSNRLLAVHVYHMVQKLEAKRNHSTTPSK